MRVRHGDVSFEVRDGKYDFFWNRLNAGRWENETFDVFDRFIDASTTVLDIGAWIGPTTLYAARKARRVIAFEPDPIAYQEIRENLARNADVTNVELHNAAVTITGGDVRLGPREWTGDSTSSILFAGQPDAVAARGVALADVLAAADITDPVFVKMDVEGYEYELLPAVLDELSDRDALVYVSMHPEFLALRIGESVDGDGLVGSLVRKLIVGTAGRWGAYRATRSLTARLARDRVVYDEAGERFDPRRRVWRVLLGGHLTGGSHSLIVAKKASSAKDLT